MNHFKDNFPGYLLGLIIIISLVASTYSLYFPARHEKPTTDLTIFGADGNIIHRFEIKDTILIEEVKGVSQHTDYLIEAHDKDFRKSFSYFVRYTEKYILLQRSNNNKEIQK